MIIFITTLATILLITKLGAKPKQQPKRVRVKAKPKSKAKVLACLCTIAQLLKQADDYIASNATGFFQCVANSKQRSYSVTQAL